jgi:hypothetical protein
MPDIPAVKPDLPLKPEKIPAPEKGAERKEQKPEQPASLERAAERVPTPEQKLPTSVSTSTATPAPETSAPAFSIADVERALSNDLEEVYFQMSPETQVVFKKKGEETARAVKTLLEKTKVNAAKIAKLILNWLKLIPGVNKFFLEQEAKIKTDEVLKLKK